MSWACIPTAPCCTDTSKTKRTAWTIWSSCAACRMKPTASSPSSRWRFTPTTRDLHHIPSTTGFDDIRQIAVSRLMLDNIPHIKAYWVMMTPKIAQIAQRFGSDDIDGTLVEERIYHDAGATTSQNLRRGRADAPDSRSRPRAGGARHAVPSGGANRERLHRSGIVDPDPAPAASGSGGSARARAKPASACSPAANGWIRPRWSG